MDNWEDWETNDIEVVFTNEISKKRLEEQKLVEEADHELTKNLFSETPQCKTMTAPQPVRTNTATNKLKPSKRNENEQKQKDASKLSKMLKTMKQRERELFGEAEEEDNYAKYDFYYH